MEEEDIKLLEYLLEHSESTLLDDEALALENLLKRYKELEEENAMLKKANNISEDVTVEDITQVVNKSLEEFKREFIPISVIQNKKKEIEDLLDSSQGCMEDTDVFRNLAKIRLCEELLEERE